MPKTPVPTVTRTLRFKIRRESYPWLEASKFVNTYQTIVVGDVSRVKRARTRRAQVQDFLVGDRLISLVGDHLTGSLAEPKATILTRRSACWQVFVL